MGLYRHRDLHLHCWRPDAEKEGATLEGLPPSYRLPQLGALLVGQPQAEAKNRPTIYGVPHPISKHQLVAMPAKEHTAHEASDSLGLISRGQHSGCLADSRTCSLLSNSGSVGIHCCCFYSLNQAGIKSLFSILEWESNISSF